jgi:cathepsin B
MMMADRTCIVSNQTKAVYFSAEDLLSCCSYCVPESKSDICKTGGIAFYALQYWIEKGVVSGGELGSGRVVYYLVVKNINLKNILQGCKPYKMSTYKGMSSPCQHSCTNQDYSVSYSKDKHFGGSISEFEYPTNVKHLQIEIMTNGPVVSFIKATPEFETNYRNGMDYDL